MELTTVLSMLIALFMLVLSLLTLVFNKSKNDRREAESKGYLSARLDTLDASISELKASFTRGLCENSAKMDDLARDIGDLRDRVSNLEGASTIMPAIRRK